ETLCIHDLGPLDGAWILSMKIFRRFALDEDSIRADFQNGMHRQDIRFDDVFESRDKSSVAFKLFIPPTKRCGKEGAYEHLVYWRVKLNPWKAARKRIRVPSVQLGKVGILEIANPIRNAEVTRIGNRQNIASVKFAK